MTPRIITLTTDFGTSDGYVGAVKGAILSINPKVRLVDLSNEIPSFDIVVGAFHLGCSFSFFPKGTAHLAVVDPGVGSERRPLLVATKNYFLVGPDNGLFTLVLQRDPAVAIYELSEKRYFRSEVSSTFHGRDLFGPVAAHLTRGVEPSKFGKRRELIKLLPDFTVRKFKHGWMGKILFFDKFGNAFTGFYRSEMEGTSCLWRKKKIPLYRTYSNIPKGQPGALFGSSGFLEIALREDSFQRAYKATRGDDVILTHCSKTEEILLKTK
jgi:S-adenosylmethionine hydrolase